MNKQSYYHHQKSTITANEFASQLKPCEINNGLCDEFLKRYDSKTDKEKNEFMERLNQENFQLERHIPFKQWMKRLGNVMIQSVTVTVGGAPIQTAHVDEPQPDGVERVVAIDYGYLYPRFYNDNYVESNVVEKQVTDFIMDIIDYDLLKCDGLEQPFKHLFHALHNAQKIRVMDDTCYVSYYSNFLLNLTNFELMLHTDFAKRISPEISQYFIQDPWFIRYNHLPLHEVKLTLTDKHGIFFNIHCYNKFFTVLNMNEYILFTLTTAVKNILHMTNLLNLLEKYVDDRRAPNFYSFMVGEMKSNDGTVSRMRHDLLCEYPFYVEFTKWFFEKRRMEFIFVCDRGYQCFDVGRVGNRVIVDEVIVRGVFKFL